MDTEEVITSSQTNQPLETKLINSRDVPICNMEAQLQNLEYGRAFDLLRLLQGLQRREKLEGLTQHSTEEYVKHISYDKSIINTFLYSPISKF